MNLTRTLFRILLGRRLPRTSGSLRVPGLSGPLCVRRDGHGIPHITAGSDEDAAFALGFVQAQDRPFQLELLLRTVRGTVAEAIGEEGLPIDRLARRIGFRRGATAQLEASRPEVRVALESYCRGVRAAFEGGLPRRPHGHALLRIDPTPWEPADAVAMHRLVSFVLPANWDTELVRLRMLLDDGPAAVRDLSGPYPDWLPLQETGRAPLRAVLDRVEQDLEALARRVGLAGASNAWALSASRTASGRALLANDPHLAPQLPPHWHLAHVRTPTWEAAGAAFLGMPAFLSAHNGHVAWGVTAGLVDNTDFFVEWIDGDRARRGDGWEPCRRWSETIRVKGGEPVEEEVIETPHGPVVGSALRGTDLTGLESGEARAPGDAGTRPDPEIGAPAGGPALALRATWLEPRPLEGFLLAHRAHTVGELGELFRHWPTVSLSVVAADTAGTIGWRLVGEAPTRLRGRGTLPAPGWDPAAGWEDEHVPFEAMPAREDPESGYLVSANNKPAEDGPGAPWLGADWIDGYRAARIEEVLGGRTDWDVEASLRLQLDVTCVPWRDLRDDVLALVAGAAQEGEAGTSTAPPADDPDLDLGLELLRGWDGRVTADSPAASVYELVVAGLVGRLVRSRAPHASSWALGRGFHVLTPRSFFGRKGHALLTRLLRERAEGWLERPWTEAVAGALRDAVGRLRREAGPDPANWAWGRVRPAWLHHPLGQVGPLGRVFDRGPLCVGGDAHTVAQCAALPEDPLAPASAVPSLRVVIPLGDWEEARFCLPGGQSGNPLSPHYDDLLPHWLGGTGVPIPWSEASVREAAVARLELVPQGEGEGRTAGGGTGDSGAARAVDGPA
ncbi:MAG: penicillin acylase family protein [Candidatus Palauibacterales bacterium]|nr:penicillin acylase family protein [Candidatus Palauibacterales bacterium]MDP2528465.1 penicillin acylase family protein [Candidatus Palauibacterales bacterium]MDP2582988.1 penicillin acylase family protein [Candidatus Palauibacterales bacterium]